METYKVVRFFKANKKPKVILSGITLKEAKAYCSSNSSHKIKNGEVIWFEGYEREK